MKLVILSGPPLSGKSTFAGLMQIEYIFDKVFVVSSDEVRKLETGRYDDFSKEDTVWKMVEMMLDPINIKRSMKCQPTIVVLDTTALTSQRRLYYFKKFKDYYKEVEVVYFKTSLRTLLKRNKKRTEKMIPEEDLKEMYYKYEPISKYEKEKYDKITNGTKHLKLWREFL